MEDFSVKQMNQTILAGNLQLREAEAASKTFSVLDTINIKDSHSNLLNPQ